MLFNIILALLMGWSAPAFADAQRFSSWPEACAAAEQVVAEGDIIFIDSPDFLFRKVAASTNSWTSHVGVVFKKDGQWIVSESTVPLSKDSSLCDFLNKSAKYRFEIRRLHRPLEDDEIAQMRAMAESLLGQWYTLGFDFDSKRLYCSKFVYLVYQSIGVEVGEIQTFRQLLSENPKSSTQFWKIWFLGSIPWERRTVTPASQLRDPQFMSP